jgi:hypothetical protein
MPLKDIFLKTLYQRQKNIFKFKATLKLVISGGNPWVFFVNPYPTHAQPQPMLVGMGTHNNGSWVAMGYVGL